MESSPATGSGGLYLGLDNFSLRPPGSSFPPQTPNNLASRIARRGEDDVSRNVAVGDAPEEGHALFHIDGQLRNAASLLPSALPSPPGAIPEGAMEELNRLRAENQRLKAKYVVRSSSGSSARRRRARGKGRDEPPPTQATGVSKKRPVSERLGPPCQIDGEGRIHYIPVAEDNRPGDSDRTGRVSQPARSATASTARSEDRRRQAQAKGVEDGVRRKEVDPARSGHSGSRPAEPHVPLLREGEEFEVSHGGRTLHVVNNLTGDRRAIRLEAEGGRKSPPREARRKRHSPEQSQATTRDEGSHRRRCPDSRTRSEQERVPKDHSPFCPAIANAPAPPGFKLPKYSIYDTRTDPEAHIKQVRTIARLSGLNEAMTCQTFSLSLTTVALDWFNLIEHGSIRSFEELDRMFTSRFVTSSRRKKTINTLIDSRQRPGESLRSYADRYYDLYNSVEGCDSRTAATSFKKGLISSPQFVQELMRRPPRDMSHLMRIVGREVDLEEYLCNPAPTPQLVAASPMPAELKHQPKEGRKQVNRIDKKKGEPRDERDFSLANTTYFNQPLHKVLKECGRMRGFEWPETKMGTEAGVKPDTKIYCSYHNERGHYTNSCQPLKDHLERLVREGKMEAWVDRARTPPV